MGVTSVTYVVNPDRVICVGGGMLYGQFLEHFHRQIYGGVYDPLSRFSDEQGLREDVIEALKHLRVPVIRWPGGCFVSSYHWKDGVDPNRSPMFDKAWRVEETNRFGTDEFIGLCHKIGAEPYICTNAGTGTPEEMSDWVEYCNLESQGRYARRRIANGHDNPYSVRLWSIGNENWGSWEMGARTVSQWGDLVRESAKMMRRVDPTIELSAAALPDAEWNLRLLEKAGPWLNWISVHQYWDPIHETNDNADYEQVMAMTYDLESSINKTYGMLLALGLSDKIRIAVDEWNLREWYHPKALSNELGVKEDEYLTPRNDNDDNSQYTMADAVFTACFLNTLNRNADKVGMGCFSPAVNTRGCIYVYDDGIVLRSTYHVFDLYANSLGDEVVDLWSDDGADILRVSDRDGAEVSVKALDIIATRHGGSGDISISIVNKDMHKEKSVRISLPAAYERGEAVMRTINGSNPDSYNDVGRNEISIRTTSLGLWSSDDVLHIEPHSVNVLCVSLHGDVRRLP